MTGTDALLGLVIAVGLVGILVPILPGTILVAVAIVVWAGLAGGVIPWTLAGVALVVLTVGGVVKYVVPGRRLQVAGIPASTQWTGALVGVVGFFVVPVVGLLIGFVLGVYLAEIRRVGTSAAWRSTRHALKAVGLGILIELAAGLGATVLWVVGVVVA